MLIKFKKVKIHNFLSLGDIELNLEDNGITLIRGENNNSFDLALSNGSGKSSIFNAICWCLTGETIQGISSDIINIYGDGKCEVTCDFDLNHNPFQVTRQKESSKSDLKIIKNGKDISGKGIREGTKILNDELPDLTSDLIGNIIILGQGLPHKFSNNTPSGRKELLEKLSKSEYMIEDIKDRLTNRKSELSFNINENQNHIIEEKAKLNIYNNNILDGKMKLQELESIDFSGIKTLSDMVETATEACNQKQSQIDEIDRNIQEDTNRLLNSTSERDKAIKKIDDNLDNFLKPLKDEQHQIDKEIEDLEFKLKHADDDICPTCGQRIPDKEHIDKQPLIDEKVSLNEKWNSLNDRIEEILKTHEEDKNKIIEAYCLDTISSRINDSNIKKQELQKDLVKLNESKLNYISQLTSMRAESETYEKNLNQLQDTINLNLARKQSTEEKIVYYNEEVEELSNRLGVIDQMLTIVKRDFRGFLLLNVINFIQTKANEYSNVVFGSNLIKFELDGNNINIAYNNKPYENLSGGEKQKVDLIIQFTIKDMLSQYLNIYCNILVLDEVFDNLDSIGCQKILKLISTLKDVDNIYIISHHADELQIAYDKEIVVVKDNSGVSKLK